jgi:hypothetical protein
MDREGDMGKKKRPILYEVFGAEGDLRRRALQASSERRIREDWVGPERTRQKKKKTRPPKAPEPIPGSRARSSREMRVTYELAAVFGLLVAVLGGTLYYFGWVRGNVTAPDATLAALAPGQKDATPGPGAQESGGDVREPWNWEEGGFFTIQAITYDAADGSKAKETTRRLLAAGFNPATPGWVNGGRQIVVYVGQGRTAADLEGDLHRVRRMQLDGRTPFASAYTWQLPRKKAE